MDYSKDTNLSEAGLRILKDRYLTDKEQSPQEAFYRVAKVFSDDSEMAERIYGYVSNLWFMFSTPILTNGGTKKGMPISCFLNYVPDSREGLTTHYTENAFLASVGGGIGGFWGHIRSDGTGTSGGSQSSGTIPFMHVVDSEMLAFSQGKTRRGSYATYQDISHPEIEEFLELRKPSGGDIHRKCLNLHHGINISDSFMSIINQCTINPSANDDWQLIDPHTKKVIRTVSAKRLWQKILETRVATGEPYLSFIDTIQKSLPISQKKLGLKVHHSNLCSEITLPTNEERTAVCCLSSLNLEKYDEWKENPKFIPDVVRFLDNVLEYFINNASDFLHRAKYSAMRERSIGLGAMGFHSYLQSKNVPFASAIAKGINLKIFKHIKEQALATSKILAEERGEAPDMEGTGLRFAHMLAIAPNASSSIICGSTSPSIEPLRANAYTQKTMSGTHFMRNKYLEKLLKEKEINTDETWKSIIANRGSVRHLEQLNDWEKDVFATAIEIDQRWIIELAADRQKEICQSQSLNIFVPSDVNIKDLHLLHLSAWKKGIKTLYYCRSEAIKRAEIISTKIERIVRPDSDPDCLACE
ncbi:ribonucleotide-diphosphate reductase subunit alpha [Pelagibacter phage Hroenn EXVC015P]|nr:ribonucleotide-diphosphate reductase subunit alpha [Pelagibacter phage Bylgja EXVC010P]QLF88341.1 ribonucleotide-diphosphate reductase subunit alpha [Pelagibacter phage Himinglaeva EXVC011P]QLF88364.1 ribonucleotide-diphosphate reductase subunit alpha [Pelagibacter phage Hroenn EXVC015P]QLF88589.1 ribonucleotide-diphosphate reductase subunit alpha [Pelagibacter phage Unn EXVC019P]